MDCRCAALYTLQGTEITGSGNEGKEGNKEEGSTALGTRKQMCLIFTSRSGRIDDEDRVSSETSLTVSYSALHVGLEV